MKPPIKKTNKSNATQSGYAYEKVLHSTLKHVLFQSPWSLDCIPFLTDRLHSQGGSSPNPDIAFQYIDKKGKIQKSNIEIKTRFDGTDWGQFQMVYNNGMYAPKDTQKQISWIAQKCAHLLNTHNEKIVLELPPSNLTLEQWHDYKQECQNKAKHNSTYTDPTQDVYIPVAQDDILEYYRSKNNSYVQVKDYGLYHFGDDVCDFGVPLLEIPDVDLRFRIKNHGSRKDKTQIFSLTVALRIQTKPCKSNISLDNHQQFPKQFIIKNEK